MLWSTRKVRSHDVAELSAFATFHSLDSPEEWNAIMKEEGFTMSWLQRLFHIHKDDPPPADAAQTVPDGGEVAPERRGLHGEYDQSGLAKRVVAAFDAAGVEDAPHLYVAQTGSTVVFKGAVHSEAILDQVSTIARGVDGATAIDTSEVKIG